MTDTTRRWRLVLGLACIAAAAIVGVVGYLRLSVEPSLNHQLPYLASSGMALILLSVLGAALVVADQLQTDDARMQELATSIERLAEALAPGIERPARRDAPGDAPRADAPATPPGD
ncbi:MAG TPA: hypothetical protein VIB48_21885 [Acidimicrobiia bacterium]